MEKFTYLAVVNILLIKEDKILLARRFNTGYFDGDYEMPSGHMDGNETVRAAAAREALEEIGVTIEEDDLEVMHVMHRFGQNYERIEFFLTASAWEGEPSVTEPEECDDVQWFALDELPQNMIPKSKAGLQHSLAGEVFSEFDEEEKI
ncbi:MAG: NUDIX domain-containing protein [Candidatus Paceibacterota bacterium]